MEVGESRHAVGARLGLCPSCVIKWTAFYHKTGSVKPGKIGGHGPPSIRGAHREWELQQIDAGGDVNLLLLADGLAERGLNLDYRTI